MWVRVYLFPAPVSLLSINVSEFFDQAAWARSAVNFAICMLLFATGALGSLRGFLAGRKLSSCALSIAFAKASNDARASCDEERAGEV